MASAAAEPDRLERGGVRNDRSIYDSQVSVEDSERAQLVTMETRESIYGLMLIYPEVCRTRHGSYCHHQVALAAFIFFLNIVLQVSLTHITGKAIMKQNLDYRNSLLSSSEDQQVRGWGWLDMIIPEEKSEEHTECCRGHQCPWHAKCCPPRVQGYQLSLASHTHSHASAAGRRAGSRRPVVQLLGEPAAKQSKGKKESTQRSASLCTINNNTIDCSQPSFAILDKWDQLDSNGDGLWTRAEAQADDANLACTIDKGITILQAWESISRGLRKYFIKIAKMAQVPGELESRTGISRSYFETWRGMAVLCSARDVNRCSQLVMDGVFDGALFHGRLWLENALDLCVALLEPGGVCEAAHPVTYLMWQQHSTQMCGQPTFNDGDSYINPGAMDDSIDLLFVQYEKITQFAMANTLRFQFFTTLILFIWYVNLLREFNDTIDLVDLVVHFKTTYADPFKTQEALRRMTDASGDLLGGKMISVSDLSEILGGAGDDDEGTQTIKITEFSVIHKVTLWAMVGVRFFLLVYMAGAGTIFILTTYSYIDLLMNAVALAFVFELPEFLFALLVSNEVQEEVKKVERLEYTSFMNKNSGVGSLLHSNTFWGLVIFPLSAIAIVHYNEVEHTYPVYEALQCACFQRGDRCLASRTLHKEWWDAYWQEGHLR